MTFSRFRIYANGPFAKIRNLENVMSRISCSEIRLKSEIRLNLGYILLSYILLVLCMLTSVEVHMFGNCFKRAHTPRVSFNYIGPGGGWGASFKRIKKLRFCPFSHLGEKRWG
jgi:hypothetical protein